MITGTGSQAQSSCTHTHADTKVVYRRYASLFFVTGIGAADNELVALEIIHRYVELLDKYFGNVSRAAFTQKVYSLALPNEVVLTVCPLQVCELDLYVHIPRLGWFWPQAYQS